MWITKSSELNCFCGLSYSLGGSTKIEAVNFNVFEFCANKSTVEHSSSVKKEERNIENGSHSERSQNMVQIVVGFSIFLFGHSLFICRLNGRLKMNFFLAYQTNCAQKRAFIYNKFIENVSALWCSKILKFVALNGIIRKAKSSDIA